MAEEPKPAEEPLVPDADSTADTAPARRRRGKAEPESIPDAVVVDDAVLPEPEPVVERADDTPAAPAAEREPDPAPRAAAMAPAAPEPPRRSGAFLGFVTGGVIAAAGGFALAKYLPGGWPVGDTQALVAQIEQQAAAMADLKSQVEALAARETPDLSGELASLRSEVEARLSAPPPAPDPAAIAEAAQTAAVAALAGIDTRLTALEKRPAGTATGGSGVSDTALAAIDREIQALKAAVEGQAGAGAGMADELKAMAAATERQLAAAAAEAEKLRAEAEAAGKAAIAQAALTRIQAALDAGGPFASAVSELGETGHAVPAVLADAAATGIPTLPDLQGSFPDAARAALDAALKSDMGDTWTDRVATYLRTQTGARSLAPREGDDPDAVLSRAEAALDGGQVAAALAEVAALPEAAKPALAAWIAAAEQREAAAAAVAALSTELDAK